MELKSDLIIDQSRFDRAAITRKTQQTNEKLIHLMKGASQWWEVGAEKYRKMRWNGETAFPKPVVLESGEDIQLPSRESGRSIPCRVFRPKTGSSRGVYYHIHGGGWVLQSEYFQDTFLKHVADNCQMTLISVGYRLAPEHPFPQGNEDCFDVADWLVDHAEEKFGAPLMVIGGDSAGAQLSVVTTFHLLDTRPDFVLRGLVLNFGAYNLAEFLPQARHFDLGLMLDVRIMEKYVEAYCPNTTAADRRSKWISPFYADLSKLRLPPALFSCGTLDCVLDDSIMMCTKWMMSGAEAILKLHPGAPHNFVLFQPDMTEETEKSLENIVTFVKAKSG